MDFNLDNLDIPIPISSTSRMSEEGKELLNLLKSLERVNKDETSEANSVSIHTEIMSTLDEMHNKYRHRGLFESNPSDKNQSFIPTALPSAKKRKRGGANSTGKIASLLNLDGNSSTGEAYVISNLCRILIPHQQHGMIFPSMVIASAAMTLNAICEYCRENLPNEAAILEQDMISSIASQLLSGLAKTMRSLLETDEDKEALVPCCKCAMNIIILSNVKLSRSGNAIELVKNVTKDIVFHETTHSLDELLVASAGLIAAIPLAGSSNNKLPMQTWSDMVMEYALEISVTLKGFFPFMKKLKRGKNTSEHKVEWIQKVKDTTPSQVKRLVIFFSRSKGIVAILTSLLKMDGYCLSNNGNGAALPITSLLEVCEQMLLFASIAETRYLSTKSRLRDVSIEGGLLSPNSAITVANGIKNLGHILLDAVTSVLTTTSLQYGRQIIRILLSSLQSSSSLALRTVIDPMSCADKNSKQKWLHSSIVLRTATIKSFESIIQRLGSNTAMTKNEGMRKGTALISGCLIEQLSEGDVRDNIGNEHWGTLDEKATLVSTCADTLSTLLSVCGGFMAIHDRELIESITSTCLYNITSEGTSSRFSNYNPVKISFLRLGTSCIASSWPDGGSSTIVGTVRRAAFALKFARDTSLSSTAYSALSICNMAQSSRAPPLVIVTRSTESKANTKDADHFFSRSSLEDGISAVKDEILKSKIIEKDVTEKKRSKQTKAVDIDLPPSIDNENEKETHKQTLGSAGQTNKPMLQSTYHQENVGIDLKTKEIDQTPKDEEDGNSAATPEEHQQVDPPLDESETEEDIVIKESPEGDDEPTYSNNHSDSDDDDDDDDFPPIIDCGPDEEDLK